MVRVNWTRPTRYYLFEIFAGMGTQIVGMNLYPDKRPHSSTASKRSRVFATYLTLGGRIRSL